MDNITGSRPSGAPPRRLPASSSADRKEERLRAANGRLYAVIALVLCCGGLIAALAGVFRVQQVDVVGNGLPVDTIIQAADVSGQNIFTVQTDQVVRRLQAVPAVSVTRVEANFPDQVVIYAQARRAAIAWQQGAAVYQVDAAGTVIGQGAVAGVPVITGGRRPPDGAAIEAVQFAERRLPAKTNGAVAGYSEGNTGLTIKGKSGWTAVLGHGDAQTMVTRVATLGALLNAVAQRGQTLGYADLRYKEPFYRIAGS